VVAILAGAWLAMREARHRGERTDIILDALIVIAVAALIGGRAYNVIDQWSTGPDYKDHLLQIILPPYSGLGIYGGLFTGLLATIWLARHYKVSFWRWADIMAPCILLAQVVGRWGNFANQELYGPPTTLPWGIAIQCQYRVAQYACPAGSDPTATLGQHFIPLFFYESMLSLLGVLVMLWLWNHFTARGRLLIAGDVGLLYFVWYGVERSLLELFRLAGTGLLRRPDGADRGLGGRGRCHPGDPDQDWYVRRRPIAAAGDEAPRYRRRSPSRRRRPDPLPGPHVAGAVPTSACPAVLAQALHLHRPRPQNLACQLKRANLDEPHAAVAPGPPPACQRGEAALVQAARPRRNSRPRPIDPIHRIEPPPMPPYRRPIACRTAAYLKPPGHAPRRRARCRQWPNPWICGVMRGQPRWGEARLARRAAGFGTIPTVPKSSQVKTEPNCASTASASQTREDRGYHRR